MQTSIMNQAEDSRSGVVVVLGERLDTTGPKYFVAVGCNGPLCSSDYFELNDAEIAFRADVSHYILRRGQ